MRASRARELYVLLGLVAVLLLGRLGHLQLFHGDSYRDLSQNNRIRREVIRAERGRLLDRFGVVLADNYPSSRLTLDAEDPLFRREPERWDQTLLELSEILSRPVDELNRQVERARARGERPVQLARSLDFTQVSRIEERVDRLTGITVEVVPVRRYPGNMRAAHALGHLGEVHEKELGPESVYRLGDQVGRFGIEREHEDVLRGRHGEAYVEVDALGRRTHFFPELPSREAIPGHDVVLTLDTRLQAAAEAALEAARPLPKTRLPQDRATPASLVALDPKTGQVLALASYPAFDPNQFVRGLSFEDWKALDAPTRPLLNRVTQSTYPPASTFKLATMLAGLGQNMVTATHRFPTPCWGQFPFGNRNFRCWKHEGHGSLDLMDAMAASCDVYFYQLGLSLGIAGIARFGVDAGLGDPTGIDLPQERHGLVPTLEWYDEHYGPGGIGRGAALNLSIGQGELLMSPIAVAQFYAAVANDGVRMRPHLTLEIRDHAGQIVRDTRAEDWSDGRLPVAPQHLAVAHAALQHVVMDERGTGRNARVGDMLVAGKTGTAQNPHGADHGLFACYAPADDPQIAVVVISEHAGGGGAVAAPIAQAVLAAFFEAQGVQLGDAAAPDYVATDSFAYLAELLQNQRRDKASADPFHPVPEAP